MCHNIEHVCMHVGTDLNLFPGFETLSYFCFAF